MGDLDRAAGEIQHRVFHDFQEEGRSVFLPSDFDVADPEVRLAALLRLVHMGVLTMRAEVYCCRDHLVWGSTTPPGLADFGPCHSCSDPDDAGPFTVSMAFFVAPEIAERLNAGSSKKKSDRE